MADPKTPIELLTPLGDCPSTEVQPTFTWRLLRDGRTGRPPRGTGLIDRSRRDPLDATTLHLRVWKINPGQDIAKTVAVQRATVELKIPGRRTSAALPKRNRLEVAHGYVWQVERVDAQGKHLVRSEPAVFYVADPSIPFSHQQWHCCDDQTIVSDVFTDWKPAYGTVEIRANEAGGGDTHGAARLEASLITGSAITQQLEQQIQAGEHYAVSFFARAGGGSLGESRFRVYAHTGDLPTTGVHPGASQDAIPIAETGVISSKEWQWIILPPWCAPRDFESLALAAFTSGPVGHGEVSNICVRQIDDCDEAIFAPNSTGPTFDLGPNIVVNANEPPTAELVTSDHGSMQDLFGDQFGPDGQDQWFGDCTDCFSVGGWLPDNPADEVPFDTDDPEVPFTDLNDLIQEIIADMKHPGFAKGLEPIYLAPAACASHDPAPAPHSQRPHEGAVPFAGRDIVFVHGLVLDNVIARAIASDRTLLAAHAAATNSPTSLPMLPSTESVQNAPLEWPEAPQAYEPDAFFRSYAEDHYWAGHIDKYFVRPSYKNRYIVTSFNCSQRLVYGVHAVLAQIADAMTTGNGVRQEGKEAPDAACFGKELVIVSHSTGAPVASVALAIAAMTADDPDLQAIYGDLSEIAKRTKVHVSMHGALVGSELALAGLLAAVTFDVAMTGIGFAADQAILGLRLLADAAMDEDDAASANAFLAMVQSQADLLVAAAKTVPAVIYDSVLVDLAPPVMLAVWSQIQNKTQTETLTVAGGHPTYLLADVVTKPALPGMDDGVVNLTSQTGTLSPLPLVYGYVPPPPRIFDMGIPLARGASFFLEQTPIGIFGVAAFGSTPHLSPTGMVQPVAMAPPIPRLARVHTFLESTSEHAFTNVGVLQDPNDSYATQYVPTMPSAARNYEETLVVDNAKPFDDGLVNPAIQGQARLFERRLDLSITMTIQLPRITIFPPSFTMESVTIPLGAITVWRRFYVLLSGPVGPMEPDPVPVNLSSSGTITVTNPPADPLEEALATNGRDENWYVYRYVLPA